MVERRVVDYVALVIIVGDVDPCLLEESRIRSSQQKNKIRLRSVWRVRGVVLIGSNCCVKASKTSQLLLPV
jgi:hypothetical protein